MLAYLALISHNFTNIGKQYRINQAIKAPVVRLIDDEDTQLGETPLAEALQLAQEQELDLVEVAPMAKPPVCKILDYGKHLYRQKKLDQKQKRQQKKTELKVIRLSLRIDSHDMEVKAKKARQFLVDKNSVKINLMFRGREAAMQDLGKQKLDNFFDHVKDIASIESPPKRQGNTMNMIIIPSKQSQNEAKDS